jgi:DNA ligase-1
MAVMAKKGEPDFTFHVFDYVDPSVSEFIYDERTVIVEGRVSTFYARYPEIDIRMVPQHSCMHMDDLNTLEAQFLAEGYEGLMIRSGDAEYKYGRSTEREGGLVKVKRFVDAEAVVVGFVEEMENTNEAKRDALGNTERSTAKAGLVGKGTLGALVVRNTCELDDRVPVGPEFNIGTGFTAAQRADLWQRREELLGQHVTYKYFAHGIVDVPRHPVYKAFRSPEDMST